ncbi:MAG: ribulose-phosphate 3-epimerase [Bacilli bacterium]
MKLSVSILNSKDRKEMIDKLNNTNISYIHMDVMDGKFVSQNTLSYQELRELSSFSNKKLDVHLMMDNPEEYINNIKDLNNIENITIHLEIDKDIKKILSMIKSLGIKRGISIKPNTDINKLLPYLNDIDLILVMTVEPGLGGQPFIETSITRLKEIKKLIKDKDILIEVDGGINSNTINLVKDADIVVVGSYITCSDDPISKINSLLV